MVKIPNRRAIIDRKKLVATFAEETERASPDEIKAPLSALCKSALEQGDAEISRRMLEDHQGGTKLAAARSFLMDQVLRIMFDVTCERVYPLSNPTAGERICLVATGGYGRGEMAPFSDVDLMFLSPHKDTPWVENVVEYMLYMLFDLVKVGHATRTIEDCIRLAKSDLTIKTSLLEARYLWGDQKLYDTARRRYWKQVVSGDGPAFVESKLAERDARHVRLGDSRYVVEPNLKDGKGGLRDLQTLFWIAKYLYGIVDIADLVSEGVLTEAELRGFRKAQNFLWTVRFHLHDLAGRGEERLTFDVQTELARRMRYQDHPGASAVERFMKHYFLVAKQVGDLTRIFCASLEARHQKRALFRLPNFRRRKRVEGFVLEGDRIMVPNDKVFEKEPVKLLTLFAAADETGRDIHPDALRLVRQNLKRINAKLRRDEAAADAFLRVLTSKDNAEVVLRMMNEAGVLGRFIPDFGRVVAQTQHDMYHHFTVDEHTIRAIGLLTRIESGELADQHPLATKILPKVISRRVLYLAVFFHDIAKGRGGDHSELGAGIAQRVCPRLGLTDSETEMVAWLVRYHLLMSHYAFKRDLADPQTILDFAEQVKSPERLRLLVTLTVVDIRAVGPGVWNGWKGQLLRNLYEAAEQVLVAGHMGLGRDDRVQKRKNELSESLARWSKKSIAAHCKRFLDSYWVAESLDTQLRNAALIRKTEKSGEPLGVATHVDQFQARTQVSVYAEDHPGLFARVTGALALAGASIVDAKIFTTRDGMALDNFLIQDANGEAFDDVAKLARLEEVILETLRGKLRPRDLLNRTSILRKRTEVFQVQPAVFTDNTASNRYTVIEVNARDRTGLLFDLAETLFRQKVSIFSAHVATYGERAVDVFYVQDLVGQKITNKTRLKNLEAKILESVGGPCAERKQQSKKPEVAATGTSG